MALGTSELTWIASLMHTFQQLVLHVALLCDNQTALYIASNPIFYKQTKHIKVDCYFVHTKVQEGFLWLFHVRTNHQLTNIFTKPLHQPQFDVLVSKWIV